MHSKLFLNNNLIFTNFHCYVDILSIYFFQYIDIIGTLNGVSIATLVITLVFYLKLLKMELLLILDYFKLYFWKILVQSCCEGCVYRQSCQRMWAWCWIAMATVTMTTAPPCMCRGSPTGHLPTSDPTVSVSRHVQCFSLTLFVIWNGAGAFQIGNFR